MERQRFPPLEALFRDGRIRCRVVATSLARTGGIATRDRYGSEFYRAIRKLRKTYYKGYITKRTKERLRQWAIREAKEEKSPALAALWQAEAKSWEE